MPIGPHGECEWLEPDGRGGFASGTVSGIRTRRYHALLLTAMRPPTDRVVLVNGVEAWVERGGERIALSAQRYSPDVIHPDGHTRIVDFKTEPWPTWQYALNGVRLTQEALVQHGRPRTLMRWSIGKADRPLRLYVRPLLSGRDYHSLHRENPGLRFDARVSGELVTWRTYESLPEIRAVSNGTYTHAPDWYRNFLYAEEQRRGLDCVEDLASPGVFTWDLGRDEAVLVFEAAPTADEDAASAKQSAGAILAGERRRRKALGGALHRAADGYIVQRGKGKTIVAGYPWFTDWGRDTFIALRGLCIARGELDTAGDILLEWAGTVSEGMLPNRFPDAGEQPEYNSVDASLWYVVAVYDYLAAARKGKKRVPTATKRALQGACEAIVSGYAKGTRFGIRMDADGLLAAGVPGVQLTWMDAKVGDWVVTPRIGKPVEIQALWLNALGIVGLRVPRWKEVYKRGLKSFGARYWREDARCLFDVIDVDHVRGRADAALRPNQVFAVGGLPFPLLARARARAVVDALEAKLLTPLGLRSLAADEEGYRPRYEGGVLERDSAYHQGTVWPWLSGPFVEAWLRVRDFAPAARREAKMRFIEPLLEHLESAGLGHISEVADADPPHHPGGCPFQAWSLGELLRVRAMVGASRDL